MAKKTARPKSRYRTRKKSPAGAQQRSAKEFRTKGNLGKKRCRERMNVREKRFRGESFPVERENGPFPKRVTFTGGKDLPVTEKKADTNPWPAGPVPVPGKSTRCNRPGGVRRGHRLQPWDQIDGLETLADHEPNTGFCKKEIAGVGGVYPWPKKASWTGGAPFRSGTREKPSR